MSDERIEAERAKRQRRLAEIREARRETGDARFTRRDVIAAINAANADDHEIAEYIRDQEDRREWDALRAELRRLSPGDRTLFCGLRSLRSYVEELRGSSVSDGRLTHTPGALRSPADE